MLPIGIEWCQILKNFAKVSQWCQMVAYGARWYQKKEFVREFLSKNLFFLQKTFLLQKETFIKTFFKELMTKRDKKMK